MTRGRRLGLGVAVAASALALSAARLGGRVGHGDAAARPAAAERTAASGPHAPRLRWPAGTEYTYALEWRLGSHAVLKNTDAPIDGEMDLAGDLVLRSLGESPSGTTRLAARLAHVRRHGLRVLGADLVPDDAAAALTFDAKEAEAFVDVDPRGVVDAVSVRRGAPALFKRVMASILTEAQLTLPEAPDAPGWTAAETGVSARAVRRYDVDPDDATIVHRKDVGLEQMTAFVADASRGEVPSIEGQATLALDGEGGVLSIRSDERAKVGPALEDPTSWASSSLSLLRTHVGPFDLAEEAPPREADLDRHAPGDVAFNQPREDGASADERLAAKTSIGEVEKIVRKVAGGGAKKGPWIVYADGLLRTQPAAVDMLVSLFPQVAAEGRVLVMDLLSSAGTPKAQAAMRSLLATPAATSDEETYVRCVQRFTFVTRPDHASMEFLAARYARGPASDHDQAFLATTYTFGAAIGAYYRTGDVAQAKATHARLVKDLAGAPGAAQRSALVAALGNAAMPEGVEPIIAHAADPEPDVRGQVATALRKLDVPRARPALFALTADDEIEVAMYAMHTLEDFDLNEDDLDRLVEILPRTHGGTNGLFVAIATKFAGRNPGAADEILQMVESRAAAGDDRDMEEKARAARAALGHS